jgi:hypothetical protein
MGTEGLMSSRRGVRRLTVEQLAAFADTTAEFGETELTRPWAETLIAVGVAAVIAHFSEGGATVLAGAAAAALAAVGVNAVRQTDDSDLAPGSELVIGGLVGLATAGCARLVPTGVGLIIVIVAGALLLRAVVIWELRLRSLPRGVTRRDRVGAVAISTLILFAASIGVAALVPGIISIPGTPSARPDAVGPFAVIATGIGSAIAAALLAARMASLRREPTSGIARDALGAALLNGLASVAFAAFGAARLAGPAGLAVLFYARELWAAAPPGERRDPRLLLEITALVIATAVALLLIGASL